MKLSLLPERPHLGPLKPVTSARTTQTRLPNGQLVLTIEHDVIKGVTPAMLHGSLRGFGGVRGEAR